MSVPDDIRADVIAQLSGRADETNWLALSAAAKSRHYDNWTKDPAIGGRLSRYLEPNQVRVYIKDALMKIYTRERRGDRSAILRLLGIPSDAPLRLTFIKPHGCLLADGRVISWGRANTWKVVLMSVHERSFNNQGAIPHAAVLTQAAAHFSEDKARAVVQAAGDKLGIATLQWRMD